MPETADEHDQKKIDVGAGRPALVAAKGDVEVIAKPTRKRNVPTPPKIGDGFRLVGRVEVFGKNKAEHESKPNRHIRIGAEVEVDLKRISHRPIPSINDIRRSIEKGEVGDLATGISQKDFLGKSEREKCHPARKFLHGQRTAFDLIGQKREFQDRSGHEVGEHRDEARKISQARHRAGLAAIDIDGVTHGLERVEADPERKNYFKKRIPLPTFQSHRLGESVVTLNPEIEVFKKTEHHEVQDDRNCDCRTLDLRS